MVVSTDAVKQTVSPSVHGPVRRSGPQEWAIEPTTAFRVNHGLGSRFELGRDERGRPLSAEQKRRFGRLRRLDKRMDARDRRLNESLRDVQSIGENVGLPRYVCEDVCLLMRQAAERRLPGGRMAWESLAAGGVLLAARRAGVPRETDTITIYAKSTHERACAAARKIRIECDLVEAFPPVQTRAVDAVLVELDDKLDARTVLEFVRLGRHLLEVADMAPVGSGTSRIAVAGAAVYAADRLTDGKNMTQAQMAEAVSHVCPTSKSVIARYSRELYDAYEERHGQAEPKLVSDTEREVVSVR
ncbi:transcription initiation factor IIB family protein [Haladaptatus halobius]|uniref:transcription initiation factor IIB family protein n=1 Tax=Haladaptatus halobius TaxID=2884875 RepID=UPI001D0AFC80|nr:transcription initiation factor IIB family protein [Haladaptatus halobius]